MAVDLSIHLSSEDGYRNGENRDNSLHRRRRCRDCRISEVASSIVTPEAFDLLKCAAATCVTTN